MGDNKKLWNSLEVTKLVAGFLTPLLLFALGLLANGWVREIERSRAASAAAEAESRARADAVRTFSRAVYGRRTRAELLASALRRGADLEELRERKRSYDSEYVAWNTDHKANLLTIRDIVGDSLYTSFERIVEFSLVSEIFAPLDACLTSAYDARIRGSDPQPILDSCDARALLQQSLDCGHALIEGLFDVTSEARRSAGIDADFVRTACNR